MRTFTSYATPYQMYVGSISIGELATTDQDELIRMTLANEEDVSDLVMKHDVRRRQAEGLWAVIVAIGSQLENEGIIDDWTVLDDDIRQTILEQIEGSALYLRLEDAEEPFEHSPFRVQYDWSEVEPFAMEGVRTGLLHEEEPIEYLQRVLRKPVPDPNGFQHRLPFSEFCRRFDQRELEIFVDRPAATQIYGRSDEPAARYLPIIIMGLFFATPVLAFVTAALYGVFAGLVAGTACFAGCVWSKRRLADKAVVYVREAALAEKDVYRSMVARGAVWGMVPKTGVL